MTLPFSFIAGLLVVVANREVGGWLPGECTASSLAWAAMLLFVPWFLAFAARRIISVSLITASAPFIPPRALLRLSAISTPLVLHALFSLGAYNDCIARLAPSSHMLRIVLALLPLYLCELPRMLMATMAEGLVEASYEVLQPRKVSRSMLPRWRDVWPVVRLSLGWPLLALMPAILLGACLDLLQLHRDSYVFVFVTSSGLAIASISFLLLASMLLPYWFRLSFGATQKLPEPIGNQLHQAAQHMGFSPSRVLLLPTGMRAVNAMMVGPLPVGRLLCLTDGLLSTLDPRALTGVLAHEIGHARMGHPGLLLALSVVVPLMLLAPIQGLDIEAYGVGLQAAVLIFVFLCIWLVVRTLARRFEHEADVSSVQTLGADPCSRALSVVSNLAMPQKNSLRRRLMSVHPDERERVALMQNYENDSEFRDQFDRRTRLLRRAIGLALLFAISVGAWFWQSDWKYERVLVRFYSGDFVGAQQGLFDLSVRPDRWQQALQIVEDELDAGLELAPGARDWASVETQLLPAAWQRGEDVLLAEGPAAARRWFALAIAAEPEPTTTQYSIYEFCRAASDGDSDRMLALAAIIERRGTTARLEPVFRAY